MENLTNLLRFELIVDGCIHKIFCIMNLYRWSALVFLAGIILILLGALSNFQNIKVNVVLVLGCLAVVISIILFLIKVLEPEK